jgi:hypothetical protein
MSRRGNQKDIRAKIKIDTSAIDELVQRANRAKAQIRQGISGSSMRPYDYRGYSASRTGRQNDEGFVFYMRHVGSGGKGSAMANKYLEPTKLSGISMVEESADYFKFGYINRGTRTILSAIPGMNDILFGVYRFRSAMVEFGRGGGAGLFTPGAPPISGQMFRGIKANTEASRIYGTYDGINSFQNQSPELNLHPFIAAAILGLMIAQWGNDVRRNKEELIEDRTSRYRDTLSTMDDREFLRWVKKDKDNRRRFRVW